MKLFTAVGMIAIFACLSHAQTAGSIPADVKIYIDPASGFDTYLAAAVQKYHVPLTITTQKDGADYEFQALGTAEATPASEWLLYWIHGYGEAGMRVINLHTGDTVFFSPLNRNAELHDWSTAARACAGRLRIAVKRAQNRVSFQHPVLDF